MSAIAGIASRRDWTYRTAVSTKLLRAQQIYGSSDLRLAGIDGATFGISASRDNPVRPASKAETLLLGDLHLCNRSELLGRLGDDLWRSSDSELLLAAWLRVGEECLSWIVGDFALAVFDGRRNVLTLARDPTGQMPLHYAQVRGERAFASMPRALKPFLGDLAIDRLAVAASVCDARDGNPRSHFENVSRVLPGEVVRLSPSGVERRIYWNPNKLQVGGSRRREDLIDEFRHVLNIAVADCLKGSSPPIATHLSSGYDSSAVTATAAKLMTSPDQIVAFTSAPKGPAPVPPAMWRIADESAIAAATAQTLGVRHIIVRSMPPVRDVIRRQSLLFQEPFISVPNIAWLVEIRRRAAALGATCLLTGDSGNLTLNAGGLYVFPEWLRQGRLLTWAHQARFAASRDDTRWRGVLFNSFQPWTPAFVREALRKLYLGAGPADRVSFLRPEWRKKALSSASRAPRFFNGYDERAYWIRLGNPGMLRKGGIAGEGVDERDPLADRRVVEFSLKIPAEHLYWNGVQRPLAKAALADRVPKAVLDSRFRGLQGADWASRISQRDARSLLDEVASSATVQDLFDLRRMELAIDRWPTDAWNEQLPHRIYRQSLIGALSGAMFTLVHEEEPEVEAGKI